MQEKATELGVKIVMLESDWDAVKQAADIEDFLAQGVDALIVNAADKDGVIPSIEKANAQGVPVFTIDSAAAGGEVLSHSGNDLYCIGYRSMEYLSEQLGGSGQVLHVNGVPGLMIVTWNDDGVKKFVTENPDIELVQQAYGEWDQAKAMAITEDALTANPDLAGVYIISELMTGGVIQAFGCCRPERHRQGDERRIRRREPAVADRWEDHCHHGMGLQGRRCGADAERLRLCDERDGASDVEPVACSPAHAGRGDHPGRLPDRGLDPVVG